MLSWKLLGSVMGSLWAVAVVLLPYGFGAALFYMLSHPTITVNFSLSKLANGSADIITVSNQGLAAAQNTYLTIYAPHEVQGSIISRPDINTIINNTSNCGVDCFSVFIPNFSHGSVPLEISSLISNKSSITSGEYTVIASFNGINAKFVQPLRERPSGTQSSLPSPFSSNSITVIGVSEIALAVSAVIVTVYFIIALRRRPKPQTEDTPPATKPPTEAPSGGGPVDPQSANPPSHQAAKQERGGRRKQDFYIELYGKTQSVFDAIVRLLDSLESPPNISQNKNNVGEFRALAKEKLGESSQKKRVWGYEKEVANLSKTILDDCEKEIDLKNQGVIKIQFEHIKRDIESLQGKLKKWIVPNSQDST